MRHTFAQVLRIAAGSLTVFTLAACGGGGSGETTNESSATTIAGRVSSVESRAALGSALGTSGLVSGIRVEAQRNDQVLDAATTDVEGRFTLSFVSDGPVDLVFATDDIVLRLALDVVPGSVVTLVVELELDDGEVIIIDDEIIDDDPIRCETGELSISDAGLDLLIDGRGGDCIRAENDCVVEVTVRSLTLVNCQRCINTESSSEVFISTVPGGFICQADEDGIRAESSSIVVIDGFDDVDISALRGNAIRAESSAQVFLASNGTCFLEAFEEAIRVESSAIVDLAGCADIAIIDDDFDDDEDDDDFDEDDDDFGGDDDD